jgi:hypothetical protein
LNSRCIINDNGRKQYENIGRNKKHVEHTARYQKHEPAPLMRQQEIQRCYKRKKQKELNGIE